MHHLVTTAEQADEALEYFNAFHDGFIRRLSLISHDTFEDRDIHVTIGLLDLEILFAHSNYREGVPPFDQLVQARRLEIDASVVSTDGPRLRARLIQPRLVDNTRWEHVEALTFSFHSGEFDEVAAT